LHASPRRLPFPLLMAIVLAACQLAASGGSPAASPASPSGDASTQLPVALPRPTDLPTDGTCEEGLTCLGLLSAGTTYSTEAFDPKITFSVPSDGWENLADEVYVFQLLPVDAPGDAIAFFSAARALNPDGSFADVPQTVAALSDWVSSNELLSVTPAVAVTVGGMSGVMMEIRIAAGAQNHPSDCPVQTCVPIFKGEDPSARPPWHWDWGTADGEVQQLYLLQAHDLALAVFVDSLDGATFDQLTAAADQILAGLTFG
jgi:hypothetical protein